MPSCSQSSDTNKRLTLQLVEQAKIHQVERAEEQVRCAQQLKMIWSLQNENVELRMTMAEDKIQTIHGRAKELAFKKDKQALVEKYEFASSPEEGKCSSSVQKLLEKASDCVRNLIPGNQDLHCSACLKKATLSLPCGHIRLCNACVEKIE